MSKLVIQTEKIATRKINSWYVLISDPTKLAKRARRIFTHEEEVTQKENHHKALELALLKYEEGFRWHNLGTHSPAAPEPLHWKSKSLPIQIGAREVVELVRFQVDVQDAIEVSPIGELWKN